MFDNRNIIAFCDNDNQKWGKFVNNIEIVSPENIVEFSFDEILISTPKYEKEIKKQLQEELDIPVEKIKNLDFSENKYKEELIFGWKDMEKKEINLIMLIINNYFFLLHKKKMIIFGVIKLF